MNSYSVTIQMNTIEQYFLVVLFTPQGGSTKCFHVTSFAEGDVFRFKMGAGN